MPWRYIKNTDYSSGNPGGTGKPFLPASDGGLDPFVQNFLDTTGAGPASVGQLVVEDFATPGAFKLSAVANQAAGVMSVGVVVQQAGANAGQNTYPANAGKTPNQLQGAMVTVGDVLANVNGLGNTNKAIAVGDPLCLDGSGNLTSAPASPAAGTVVAFARAAVAGGAATALVRVKMGGY